MTVMNRIERAAKDADRFQERVKSVSQFKAKSKVTP